jgi:hypothetical protein
MCTKSANCDVFFKIPQTLHKIIPEKGLKSKKKPLLGRNMVKKYYPGCGLSPKMNENVD